MFTGEKQKNETKDWPVSGFEDRIKKRTGIEESERSPRGGEGEGGKC